MLVPCGLTVLALASTVAAEDPETMPPALADAVRQAFLEEQYGIAPGADGTWQATNPAQGVTASFSPSGLGVSGVDEDGMPWTLGLRLEGWGRGSSLTRATEGSCEASGRRVEIRRGGLTEWYLNDERGIEQGFTIASAPGPSEACEPLQLLLAVDAGFAVEVLAGERDARLTAVDRGPKLSYSGLRAWDADGRELEARLSRTAGGLAILVDDRDATYPITVDPWIWREEAKLTASDAAAGDTFGHSVAISGFTALIGARNDDDGGTNSGSAYAFAWNGALWTQQSKLTAGDAAPDDRFGHSVSVFGDTALIGAYLDDDWGSQSGSAYVFVRTGSVWSQQAKLTAGDAAAYDEFGCSVGSRSACSSPPSCPHKATPNRVGKSLHGTSATRASRGIQGPSIAFLRHPGCRGAAIYPQQEAILFGA